MAVFISIRLQGSPQQTSNALKEDELERLLTRGASNKAIGDLVQKYGVSFQLDDLAVERLRKSGAEESLLETIRRAALALKPPKIENKATSPPLADSGPGPEAIRHFRLGEAKTQVRDYDGALREFAEAERAQPQWGEVIFRRSLLLAMLERYSEAAVEGKKYVALLRSGAEVETLSRKIVEWEREAEKREKANRLVDEGKQEINNLNIEAAIASFQAAVNLDYSVGNLLHLAAADLLKGDYESVKKTADGVLILDPHSAYAFLYKGEAEFEEGEAVAAMSTVQRGLELNPDLAFGYSLLGPILGQKEDLSRKVDGRPVGLVDPNSAWVHNRVGWILWNGGDFHGALDELRKATQIEPTNSIWYTDLSYALHFRREAVGALAAAREALRLDSKLPSAHDAMGLALESGGSLDQASREYEEAIRLSSPGFQAFVRHLNHVKQK